MKSKIDKQKGLLQVGGVFVFLTVVALFFILGDGFGDGSEEMAETVTTGLNTELPDPDDVYASRGKLEAVRKEQSRVDMERNRHLAQSSSFDMLNSLSAPKDDKIEPVDVDKLLGESGTEVDAAEPEPQPQPAPEVAPVQVKPSAKSSSASRASSAKPAQPSTTNWLDEGKEERRIASAKRRIDRHIGTHEDSLLLGLAEEKKAPAKSIASKGGFNGINEQQQLYGRTQIRAVIHGEQKNVRASSQVKLRLLESVTVNGVVIPKNTFVVGKVTFGENRVDITTEKINYNGDLYAFNGTVYDMDGMKGLYAGDNLLNDVAKKSGEGALSESDFSTSRTGIISRTGQTIVDGTKMVIQKRQRLDKVDLPANYEVYIHIR